jgi:hypothetical protein
VGLLLLGAVDGNVLRQLKEARRWLVLQQFLDYAVWGLFTGLAVLAVSGATSPSFPGIEVSWPVAIAPPLVLAALAGVSRWLSLKSVARELDARAKTKDRFVTALALPANETGGLCSMRRGGRRPVRLKPASANTSAQSAWEEGALAPTAAGRVGYIGGLARLACRPRSRACSCSEINRTSPVRRGPG